MAANKMAMLTEQKLKEMEAEMNRFEEEILTREGKLVPGHPRMIIGANTYNKVQAKISKHGEDSADDGHDYEEDSSDVPKIPISVLAAPPPPPPSLLSGNKPRPTTSSLAPPPPPPPTLSFVPPQLRGHRPPPPPIPRPPMQGPPRPPPPGYMGPGPFHGPHGPSYHPGPPPPPSGMPPHMMPPGGPGSGPTGHVPPPFMGHNPNLGPPIGGSYGVSQGSDDSSKSQATIISKPKVVYSAAPVRTVPKGGNSKEKTATDKSDKEKTAGPSVSADATDKTSAAMGSTSGVVLGPAVMPPDREELSGQTQEATEAEDAGVGGKRAKKDKKKKFVRTAAGDIWEDQSLEEWDTDDFRIFCGDLGNEVTDEVLARAFSKYSTFIKSKVIRDKRTNKTKGYGFVSFKDPTDFVRAMREMNGKYVGNRPIKLRKSTWKDRNIEIVRKKEKEKKRLGLR